MLEVGLANYAPTLRWKKGEYEALAALDESLKDRLLPNIIMTPISSRDVETNRRLTRDEFASVQVGRLSRQWGRRPCLIDCRFVEFAPSVRTDAKRLSAFLLAASKFGCGVIPVFDMQTNEYRLDAIREHWLQTNHGVALRLSLSDLGRGQLNTLVQERLLKLVVKPTDCFLLMDFSDAELSDRDDFGNFAYNWLLELRKIGTWRRIVFQATNYPERNPAPPNGLSRVERAEWKIWDWLFGRDPQVREIAMFGDFGADNAKMKFDGGGAPITHLRYATEKEWLIVRGGPPTKKGDGSIRQVAKTIVASGEFEGAGFSAGDECIAAWAAGTVLPGGAAEWRKANMGHHWTRVLVDIAALSGLRLQPKPRPPVSVQEDMFSLLSPRGVQS
jgi:hypothetical protein